MVSGLHKTLRRACAQMAMRQHGGKIWRRCRDRKCTICTVMALIGYGLVTIFAISTLWPLNSEGKPNHLTHNVTLTSQVRKPLPAVRKHVDIEVWGKAAIGLYFWEHIVKGPLVKKLGGVWHYGEKRIESLRFKFRMGPGVVPDKVPKGTKNLVLILNGREDNKIMSLVV